MGLDVKKLNRWQCFFQNEVKAGRMLPRGWRGFEFGIVKLTSLPKEGEEFTKKNYKGVWLHFFYFLPFDLFKQ